MSQIRPSYRQILGLVTSIALAPPAICQVSQPERPPEPPVWKFEAVNVPVLRLTPNPNAVLWTSGWDLGAPGRTPAPEQVAKVIVTYPRQSVYRRTPSNSAVPGPEHEFGGRTFKFGRSGSWAPQSGQGWYFDGYRDDCLKALVQPFGSSNPTYQTMWEQWEGEDSPVQVTFPCVARELRIRFSGGVAVGARFDEDCGTRCLSGHLGMICMNPACPQYAECRTPWAYPNIPHELCGHPGPDVSRDNFGLYQFTTPNMIVVGNQPSKWEAPTVANTGNIRNAGTVAQSFTTAGTPAMWFWLVQTEGRSDMPYTAPGRGGNANSQPETYPQWNDGIYATLIYDLVLHKAGNYPSGSPRYVARFKAEKYALWSFTVGGLFDFIGDWFACDRFADMDSNGCHDASDVFAFLSAWFGGQ